jgi:hypothetical protein
MKEFDIFLEGTWSFYCSIKANSKEEAIKQAMKAMEEESGSIDLYHTNQWLDGEEEGIKKAIHIVDLESGSINHHHTSQWTEGEY